MIGTIFVPVWAARAFLLSTGTYYHQVLSEFVLDNPYQSTVGIIGDFGKVGAAILWLACFRERSKRRRRVFLVTAVAVTLLEFAWYAPTGTRDPLGRVFIVIVMAYVITFRRLPAAATGAIVVFGFLAFSFIETYRFVNLVTLAEEDTRSISPTGLLSTAEEAEQKFSSTDFSSWRWVSKTVERLCDARSLAAIIENVPENVPFLYGETYQKLPWVFIPRYVAPFKPKLITPLNEWLFSDEVGSSPTTLVGEAYLNFGWSGIVIVMTLLGLLGGCYDLWFAKREADLMVSAAYVATAAALVRIMVESSAVFLSTLINGILLALVLNWGYQIVLGAKRVVDRRDTSLAA
jgi:hypothetical protein